MAYDLAQDLATGDLVWDSKRDLAGADGFGLIQQRIHRRLMVERGEYLYDTTGTLGSRLRSLLTMGVPLASGGIEQIIRDALSPMPDVRVTNIEIYTYGDGSGMVTSPTNILAVITYEPNISNVEAPPQENAQFTANVSIPV
jgi:hypothetical protein